MRKPNDDLRKFAKGLGVPLWAVADAEGVSEQTLYRNWRRELGSEEKDRIRKVITMIAKERDSQ